MKTGDLERHFDEKRYSDNIDLLNTGLARLTLADNVFGEVKDIDRVIANGEEINIPHNLKGVPIGMIILRQRGNGKITDGVAAQWTPERIAILNNGPDDVEFLRIFILRS